MTALPLQTRGRGARSNASGRFEAQALEAFDDGWTLDDAAPGQLRTTVTAENAGQLVHLRVELQTLFRLPRSNGSCASGRPSAAMSQPITSAPTARSSITWFSAMQPL